jgi:hypothetical protein
LFLRLPIARLALSMIFRLASSLIDGCGTNASSVCPPHLTRHEQAGRNAR